MVSSHLEMWDAMVLTHRIFMTEALAEQVHRTAPGSRPSWGLARCLAEQLGAEASNCKKVMSGKLMGVTI